MTWTGPPIHRVGPALDWSHKEIRLILSSKISGSDRQLK